jgi:hypothetical protein
MGGNEGAVVLYDASDDVVDHDLSSLGMSGFILYG